MIYIRVVETVYNLTCELLQFLLRQRQGRDYFVINGLQHEVTDIVIMHGLSYDVVAAQIGSQYERRYAHRLRYEPFSACKASGCQ